MRAALPRRSAASERGSVLLEFALASTLLFVTLFAAISGGLSVYRYNMLSDLAQEGARWGSVRGLTSGLSGEGTRDQLEAFLRSQNPSLPITVAVSGDPGGLPRGATLRVTVNSTWVPASGFVDWGAFPISAAAEMVIAR